MNAAVSSTSADPSRRVSSRYQVGLGQPEFSHGGIGQDAAGIQAGLFEQILSLPVPIETDFQASADDWASQAPTPQPTTDKSENEGHDESQPEDSASSEENDELAASVAAIDQTAVAVGLGDEQPIKDVEIASDVSEEPELLVVQPEEAVDLSPDDETQHDSTSDPNAEQAEKIASDKANASEQVADEAAISEGSELLQDSIDSDAAAQQSEDEQQKSVARRDAEQLGDDHRVATEADGNDEPETETETETSIAVSKSDTANDGGENRRETRDRPERWFEKDASEQADAREAARADEKQKLGSDDRTAVANELEAQEFNKPIAAEQQKPADEGSAEPVAQNLEQSTPSILTPRESLPLPAGFTATDSDGADRGPQNLSGLGRATEKPGAPPPPPGTKATAPGDSVDLTQQERVRLVQRVARSFARIGPEGGQINLRLHPPQLGSLNVQVRLEGRSMTANLTTESGAARDAILESLPVLRSRLAEQGFEISQFQVDVTSNGSDASQGGGQNQTHDHGSRDRESQFDYRRLARGDSRFPQGEQQVDSINEQNLVWQTHTGIDIHA